MNLPLGQWITLPGHFDRPVLLEDARPLGSGYEVRVRLQDGTLEEAVISEDEARRLAALGKLLANWRALIEASAMPLYDRGSEA